MRYKCRKSTGVPSATGVFALFYKCLPAMLIYSVGVWQVRRWWANMLLIYFLNQPAAPTALFTFVVAVDGSMTMSVYESQLERWKV